MIGPVARMRRMSLRAKLIRVMTYDAKNLYAIVAVSRVWESEASPNRSSGQKIGW